MRTSHWVQAMCMIGLVLWGAGHAAAEPADLLAVTPLPGGHVQLEYDTDGGGEADLFQQFHVLWQGWSNHSDQELQQQALRHQIGIVTVEPDAIEECAKMTTYCRGWRYVYLVVPNPIQSCQIRHCHKQHELALRP